jgi:hypothetical protein
MYINMQKMLNATCKSFNTPGSFGKMFDNMRNPVYHHFFQIAFYNILVRHRNR